MDIKDECEFLRREIEVWSNVCQRAQEDLDYAGAKRRDLKIRLALLMGEVRDGRNEI